MKRTFLIGLPIFLLIVLLFAKSQWDKRPSNADVWLAKQAREVTDITIHDWNNSKRIHLKDMQKMQVFDRKTIQQILHTLHCSGTLTEMKGQTISDVPSELGINISLSYKNADHAEVELREHNGHNVLVRIGHGINGGEYLAMAQLYPKSGAQFIKLIRSLVAEAKKHPKSSKVTIYEVEPGS